MKRRKGFTLIELLVVVAIIALLISILLPSLSRARELAKRAVCAANLRGIGQSEHIYSNDNLEWFPHHMYVPTYSAPNAEPQRSGVNFEETMGSGSNGPNISEKTTTNTHSNISHPSRSMFMLVIDGMSTTKQYICPSSGDEEDDLRNRGGDHQGAGNEGAAQPGINRFDFRGWPWLSYGYQLPYGRRAKPRENLDVRMPVNADKGSYYTAGSTDTGTQTTRDRRNTGVSPPQGSGWGSVEDVLRIENERWRPYNSSNHNGEGQNVLFIDSHVEFVKKPIVGINNDNIYTISDDFEDQLTFMLGEVASQSGDGAPLTNTDACIIP